MTTKRARQKATDSAFNAEYLGHLYNGPTVQVPLNNVLIEYVDAQGNQTFYQGSNAEDMRRELRAQGVSVIGHAIARNYLHRFPAVEARYEQFLDAQRQTAL